MDKKKISLKTRMLVMMTSLILIVFTLILVFFNVLISSYIESNATEVLSQSRDSIQIPVRNEDFNTDKMPKSPQTPAGSAERLFVTEDYEVLTPDFYPVLSENSPLYDFTEAVEDRQIDLGSTEILKLETEEGLYYYTVVRSQEMDGRYQVNFINMSNLYSFEKDLIRRLLLVMSGALLLTVALTYIISSRIAGPVKTLSTFAKRIGDGDYGILEQDFHDREVHELKNSMNESSRKLKEYDENQRVFFQNASHELRTPLQIIKSNAEALEYDLISKEKAVKVIENEVDSLGELVEDIMILSRLDARSQDTKSETGDLRETLSYTMERFTALVDEKGIQVEYDFQKDPVYLSYDEKTMERALKNLVDNAVRYAQKRINISLKEAEGRIVLKVTDDGPGISEEDRPRIFDRFYKGAKGHHGIGLSIVKSIINAYEGRIEVSTGSSGTTFTIFFPASSKKA